MAYVYMKSLEKKAEKYDKGMATLTRGKYPAIKKFIADNYLDGSEKILDIGMGTGTFAIMAAMRGAEVWGLDQSEKMLEVARKNIQAAGLDGKITITRAPVVNLDALFADGSFDKVTAMLFLGELYGKEQDYCLEQIRRILKEDGELIVVDEVKPRGLKNKIFYYLVRFPLALITFLKTRLTTRPLDDPDGLLERHGFRVVEKRTYLRDTLLLIRARKVPGEGLPGRGDESV